MLRNILSFVVFLPEKGAARSALPDPQYNAQARYLIK